MKKIIFTAFIAAVSLTTVSAQETGAAKSAPVQKEQVKSDIESLNLTASQREQITSLKEKHQSQLAALKKEGVSGDKIEALRTAQQEELNAILTTEQRAELTLLMKKRMEQEHQDEIIKQKLANAAQQKQAAAPSNPKEEMAAKMKAIQEDPSLTDTQKKDQIKQLMQQYKDGKNYTEEEKAKLPTQKKHNINKKTSN